MNSLELPPVVDDEVSGAGRPISVSWCGSLWCSVTMDKDATGRDDRNETPGGASQSLAKSHCLVGFDWERVVSRVR